MWYECKLCGLSFLGDGEKFLGTECCIVDRKRIEDAVIKSGGRKHISIVIEEVVREYHPHLKHAPISLIEKFLRRGSEKS